MSRSRVVSVQEMLSHIDGLRDTGDLTEWEESFVESTITKWLERGKRTDWLSEKQLGVIERLWDKHFA